MTSSLSLLLLLLVVLVDCCLAQQYFLVYTDNRKCAAPKCGGYFLKPVNDGGTFECPAGVEVKSKPGECYVVSITGIQMSSSISMVRGSFVPYDDSTELSSFQAVDGYEGKIHPHPANNLDPFYTANDVGLACSPTSTVCNTIHASKLNQKTFSRTTLMFAEMDYSKVKGGGGVNVVNEVNRHLKHGEDVIVAATAYSVSGDAQGLAVSNYFYKVKAAAKTCTKSKDCIKGEYCSKTSCTAGSGECHVRPSSCDRTYAPVCACDGSREYDNDCIRMLLGISASSSGKCASQD